MLQDLCYNSLGRYGSFISVLNKLCDVIDVVRCPDVFSVRIFESFVVDGRLYLLGRRDQASHVVLSVIHALRLRFSSWVIQLWDWSLSESQITRTARSPVGINGFHGKQSTSIHERSTRTARP
jgi:hypothetical protein